MKLTRIRINRDGSSEILDVKGHGQNCQSATARLEKKLGIVDETSRKDTVSLFEPVDDIKLTSEL